MSMEKNQKRSLAVIKRPFSSSTRERFFRHTQSYVQKVGPHRKNLSLVLPVRLDGPEKLLVEGKNKLLSELDFCKRVPGQHRRILTSHFVTEEGEGEPESKEEVLVQHKPRTAFN